MCGDLSALEPDKQVHQISNRMASFVIIVSAGDLFVLDRTGQSRQLQHGWAGQNLGLHGNFFNAFLLIRELIVRLDAWRACHACTLYLVRDLMHSRLDMHAFFFTN